MLNAVCLKSFLKVTGATIDQTEGSVNGPHLKVNFDFFFLAFLPKVV